MEGRALLRVARVAARDERVHVDDPALCAAYEFLDDDQLGFWERYCYNNDADPWKEERYSE